MNILLLTDFSELADYARFLADKCAVTLNANLEILKIVDIPSDVEVNSEGEPLDGMFADTGHLLEKKKAAQVEMKEWTKDLQSSYSSTVMYGHFQRSVRKFIEDNSIDLVIMGTHGVSGFKEFLSGSITETLIKNNRVPVLSLKCDRSDVSFEHILLSGDFEGFFDFTVFEKIQAVFNSKLHLISVVSSKEEESKSIVRMRNFALDNNLENTDFHTIIAKGEEEGIELFMNQYEKDNKLSFELLGVEKKDKSSLGYLLTGCQATSIVNHIWRPILTYLKKN